MGAFTRHSLVGLLQEYRDVFAFSPEEMPGIDPTVMEHKLNMGPEQAAKATVEVQKLLEVGFIRECQYS